MVYARRYWRNQVLLAKIGTTYGVDSVPTGASNTMLTTADVDFRPMAAEEVRRDLLRPYFGHQGVEFVGVHAQISFAVETAGSGEAGVAPAWGVMHRACGCAETIIDDTAVEYEPATAHPEWVDLYMNVDGVNHALLGARGTWVWELSAKQIPRWRYTMTGLFGPITGVALPATTITAFQRPRPGSKANTPTATVHGLVAPLHTLQITQGNTVVPRMLINDEEVLISNRETVGSVQIDAPALATKNFFAIADARTSGAIAVVHGTVAGNIVEFGAGQTEIGLPTYGQVDGVVTQTLPLFCTPASGDDEWKITVR